jgi:hypothetical protein
MKGVINKTEQGWVIRQYDEKHPAFKEIQLCSEDSQKMKKEVDFLIVKRGNKEYAKLIKRSLLNWFINKLKWVSNK